MQNLNIKMQNEREEFKKNFVKRLIRFSIKILAFSENLVVKRTFCPIADQVIRSATSIGANVVEAKASSSKRDYLKFFEIALKSANETKYWLTVIKEARPDLSQEAGELLCEAEEIAKIIGASVLTLKDKR
jgi:four helix bundle protein